MSIAISCDCGKTMRVNDSLAGKRIKCPGCGKVLAVSASAPPSNGLNNRNAKIANRSVKPASGRQQESTRKVVLFAALGVVALALVGAGVYLLFPGPSPSKGNVAKTPEKKVPVKLREKTETPKDTISIAGELSLLDMVPADAFGFVQVRIGEFLTTPSGKKTLSAAPPGLLERLQPFDISPTDLKELVAVFPVFPLARDAADKTFFLISSEKPIDVAKVRAAEGVQVKDVGGKAIYLMTEKNEKKSIAVQFASSRKAIVGQESALAARATVSSGPLAGLIGDAKGNRQLIYAGFHVPNDVAQAAPASLLPLVKAQRGRVTLNEDQKLKLTLTLTYADVVQSVEAKNALDGLLKQPLSPEWEMLPAPLLGQAMQNIKASVKGINLVVSTQLETTCGDLAMSLGAAKKGP
jgi:hypothetical protein